MRRFVCNIIIFSLLSALFVVLMTALLGAGGKLRNVVYRLGMWDYTHTRLAEARHTSDVDILFIGSSHAYRSFDPRFYASRNISVFNLGSSNQTPLQSEMLLRLFLDTIRPRLVVMEVHPDIICLDGVESSIYLSNSMPPSWPVVGMALRTHNAKAILSMVYSATHNILSPEYRDYKDAFNDSSNVYVPGGFVERRGGNYAPEPITPSTITFNGLQMRSMRAIIAMLAERSIPLLLVEVPDTRALRESYINHDEFVSRMAGLGPFRSVRLAALNDTLHFYDPGHMNQSGVELFEVYFYDSVLKPFAQCDTALDFLSANNTFSN